MAKGGISKLAKGMLIICEQEEIDLDLRKKVLLKVFPITKGVRTLLQILDMPLSLEEIENLMLFIQEATEDDHQLLLRFFMLEFSAVYEHFSNENEYYYWGEDIIAIIIPLFILLLTPDLYFDQVAYLLGDEVCWRLSFETSEHFINSFKAWRQYIELSEVEVKKYLSWVESEVQQHGQSILKTEYRSQYGRMAHLVVALGYALEANGEQDGKNRLIDQYYNGYPYLRNFRAELKRYR